MLRHLIVGKGNLGCDVFDAAIKRGDKAMIVSRSTGFEWPDSLPHILQWQPTHVWITAGAGSVDQVKKDFAGAIKTHVVLPSEISDKMPLGVRLIFFSSDYAANEFNPEKINERNSAPRSLYAATKVWMEQALELKNRPNSVTFRVGSLYGHHYPQRCLPGKLLARFPTPARLELPQNWISPTPTWWIAESIMERLDTIFKPHYIQYNMAPIGGCSVQRFGQLVLGNDYQVDSKGFDSERPINTAIGNSFDIKKGWEPLYWDHLSRAKTKEVHEDEL